MLRLIRLNETFYDKYKDMMDEWHSDGSNIAPWPLRMEYKTKDFFMDMIKRINEVECGENLGPFAESTTYWLYDDETYRLIGASNLRHYLTEEGKKLFGHIGYGIRPTERRKGYGTELLKMTLKRAKDKNIDKVLLGAYEDNIASWKLMEKCGRGLRKYSYR